MLMFSQQFHYIDLAILSASYGTITSFHGANHIFTAITVHDWILTLPLEIRVIWSWKMTGAKVLFLSNRYLWIASCLVEVMADQWVGVSDAVSTSVRSHNMLADLESISRGALTLRTISGRRLIILSSSCSRLGDANEVLVLMHNLVVSGSCQPSPDADPVYTYIRALWDSISDFASICHQRA